jgi:Ca2+-binding EF-hand superfamily protein
MRMLRSLLLGFGVLAMAGLPAMSQAPEGGSPPAGGFPGGGGGGGFGRGGRGGGGGMRNMDPNELFNRFSNGKDVINRAELAPQQQFFFDRIAQRAGITGGTITREQFVNAMNQRRGGGGPGGAPAAGGGGGQGQGGGGGNADQLNTWAEGMFRRLDQNGDGLLNNDEMPEELRNERDKWDTNKDGFIDLNEFKAYFTARFQQRMQENAAAAQAWAGVTAPDATAPAEEEDKKPVVYRAGKLPKELPAWFQQLDTDSDGQIGLYEWKASGRPMKEFEQMDRNGDGFLTVEEVLYYMNKNKTSAVASGQNGAPNGASFASPGGGNGNQGFGGNRRRGNGGGGRGNGGGG